MTASAIVETALRENLSIIAITDHNEIGNVGAALTEALGTSLLVIPGIELSTAQGHLLCYLPNLESLQKLCGQLSIVDRGMPNSRCQQSVLDCLNLLPALGGFGILAHVDVASGFETEQPGGSPHKADVLCHPALLGIELKHANSPISYAEGDPDATRAEFGKRRIECLRLGSKQYLARVLNSDSHKLNALGRNAANLQRVTRYKMDTPSFDGLRVALEDADARVRIEDQIPPAVPRILGVHIDGGFLSGQVIHFSSNLNCIIGGRGTGKSTSFETIRCLSSAPSDNKVIDSEVWPDELHLFWQDQAGAIHGLLRLKDGCLENLDDAINGPTSFDIDCFGQGEAAKISNEAQSDPLALLRYLDRFIDLTDAMRSEEEAREELLTLQSEIEKAEQQLQLIPQYESLLQTAKQQLTALKKPEVKELIELQQHLASERELRQQIAEKLQDVKEDIRRDSFKASLKELRELSDPSLLAVGGVEFGAIVLGATAFEAVFENTEAQISLGLKRFEAVVSEHISAWKAKENESQQRVDAKRRELEGMNISFDMSYISKLARDEAAHQQRVTSLKTWQPYLAERQKLRAAALKRRWNAREKVSMLRDGFGRLASATLREALSDLQVSLKYAKNAHSPEACDLIIQTMGWRTSQQARAGRLVGDLTVPTLLAAIERNDITSLTALKTPEGIGVFKPEEARLILQKLAAPEVKYALERVPLHDLPRLQVSRAVQDVQGGVKYVVREFSKLSLGQQQSVLLALILSANSNKPLIIDQPEDNLDGEFIYQTLVPVLRRAKERRQVIIVTHNPNVAVLGDAELIVVMKAQNDRGKVVARGSIDHPETRDKACAILEGAHEAFVRRAKMYGLKIRDM
nr:AAA family ATPase [Dyella flagellata]